MKVRKIGIATKIFWAVIALLVISDILIGSLLYNRAENLLVSQIKENAMNIARCSAASVDGSLLPQINVGDEETDIYKKAVEPLINFRDNSGVEYVYTIHLNDSGVPVFLVDTDPEEPAEIGSEFGSTDAEVMDAFAGQTTVNADPYTDEWGTHISAFSPIYDGQDVVALAVVDVSVNWVNEQTHKLLVLILVVCAAVLAAGIVILFIISSVLRRGFSTLNDKVVDLVHGDGDLTKHIEISSGDEFEVIGNNINALLTFIHDILVNISADSEQLQTSAKSIAGSMTSSFEDSDEISAAMEELNAAMSETAGSIDQIYRLMQEMTEGFDTIHSRIRDGNEFTESMRTDAETVGERAISEQQSAEQEMTSLEEEVRSRIESSRAVEQINGLTDDILNISQQTNLLSLNASIEAARAGDAGRGFAVVASEIGNLAQDSARAASQIQSLSTDLIADVNELAKAAEAMITFIRENAMKGYTDLVATSENYRGNAEKIDVIIRDCYEISQKLSDDIGRIRDVTNSVNTAVSESADGVSQASDKITDLSVHLSSIGQEANASRDKTDELFDEVGHFRL